MPRYLISLRRASMVCPCTWRRVFVVSIGNVPAGKKIGNQPNKHSQKKWIFSYFHSLKIHLFLFYQYQKKKENPIPHGEW